MAVADKPPRHPRRLGDAEHSRRLDEPILELDGVPGADEQSALVLDLQVRQIERQMQDQEPRETQEALELSRDHYARLFDLAPVGIAVFDRRGRIREINLTAARMLGSAPAGLTDAPFVIFLDEGTKRDFLTHVERVVGCDDSAGEGAPKTVVVRLRGMEARRILRLHCTVRVGDAGRECFSALVDVTVEEAARAHQASSDHLRQTVLDALPAQVAVLDGRGRLIAVNEAWRRFADENGASAELQAGVGCDYLSACRHARGDEADSVREIADGIQAVLDGDRPGLPRGQSRSGAWLPGARSGHARHERDRAPGGNAAPGTGAAHQYLSKSVFARI